MGDRKTAFSHGLVVQERRNPIKATFGSTMLAGVGSYYERDNGSTVRKYYYAGAVRVAMRAGGQTYYLLAVHPSASSEPALSLVEGTSLGSTNVTANSSGVQVSKLLYKPWGETRYSTGSMPTAWRFTGQREDAAIGL